MKAIGSFAFVVMWVAGWVMAQGFWLTALAIFFPPYGWYLIIERLMRMAGII